MNYKKTQHFILLIMLYLSQYIAYSQRSPDLKSALSYSLFTGAGAITNTGNTIITGDVGYNTGSVTGFPPGIINGETHYGDAVSSTVNTDVFSAYSYLFTLPCDTTLGTALGNSQILTAGVYCLGGASTLSDTLYLDGENDPNAEFIFIIGGAFSTAPFSEIILLNQASNCHVYWNINGAFSTGDSSVFKGTIVGDGEVIIGLATDIEGRVLTRTGAISIDSSTIFLAEECLVVLPIVLLNFSGQYISNNDVELNWTSATEINNHYYTIEKSIDCDSFFMIYTINGLQNSYAEVDYQYIDQNTYKRTCCYRLKQTDMDGTETLLKTIVIVGTESSQVQSALMYPNPHHKYLYVVDPNITPYYISILTVINSSGKTVLKIDLTEKHNKIETNLTGGIYHYIIQNGNHTYNNGKLLVY